MTHRAAITVGRSLEEVQRLWSNPDRRPHELKDATVTFTAAPGDRGTEIHVELSDDRQSVAAGLVEAVTGAVELARAKDALRRFKQRVETGEIPRSDAVPEGERVERKLKQRPAQPLSESELEEVAA